MNTDRKVKERGIEDSGLQRVPDSRYQCLAESCFMHNLECLWNNAWYWADLVKGAVLDLAMKRQVADQHQGPGGELVYSGDDNDLFLIVNPFWWWTISWWWPFFGGHFFGDDNNCFVWVMNNFYSFLLIFYLSSSVPGGQKFMILIFLKWI